MIGRGLIGTAVAMSALLTGCSTVAGEAIPDADSLKLDTGNYPTTPRGIPSLSWAQAGIQGNIALSDYLVAPPDVDAAFDVRIYAPFSSINDANSMTNMVGDPLTYALLPGNINAVVAPFVERSKPGGAQAAQMATMAFRYLSETDAASAIAEVKKVAPANRGRELSKYPAAYDGPAPTRFGGSSTIWLQYKEFVIAASFTDVSDRTRVESLATGYFDRQLPQLDKVPFRPSDGRKLPADKEGILRLTMVDPTSDGYQNGYFTPRAWALYNVGAWTAGLEQDRTFGIDLIGAEGRNSVRRASDSERASSFVRELNAKYSRDGGGGGGGRLEAPVPNLEGATCISRYANLSGSETRVYICAVSRGRYIASTQASSLQQAHQSASASWTVIKNAGN